MNGAALKLASDTEFRTKFTPSNGCGRKSDWLYWSGMDVERIIFDIEQLEEMFEAADIRPLSAADISAANRRHDEALAESPWFRLWQSYGVCCRPETPVLQIPE